ncbi:hypothetical protein [Homoserinibacter sp. YIM 151385]|uniref:hypothetical protein n=1 Tax=Homoserinibacter sp. YIM 151385 TaxID=2985506 RepID=UPI0022F0191E|nr:hypothetical protein [Homoserinibacter sp. YIM 151385]WBU38241.1 hypothetical protein OF852_01265 [Homoserinibacter sp. YIM 151385]
MSAYQPPEENTLGVVVGNARRAMSSTARRLARASATHRASLGTRFLGLGAAVLVGLRSLYGLVVFTGSWSAYPNPWLALAAWVVLIAVLVAAFVMARVIGDRLPDWMFGLFLTGLAVAFALDMAAVWTMGDIGRYATAGLAAGMGLLIVVTIRGTAEVLIAIGALGLALALIIGLTTPLTATTGASQITALALAVIPVVIGVVIVGAFRRMVQVEIDRVLVQSNVTAPRFAVGMLASEELARLDLAAEELLDSIAKGQTPLPLEPKTASVAASLATELRLHLIEGRRETWLYHAVSESELLGKAVTLVDKSSLAGLLDPAQRDGLLSTAWLIINDIAKPNAARSMTIQIGPVVPGAPAPDHKIAIPITITTQGLARNRVDPAVWDALGRVGRYSDSTQDSSLRVDIDCIVDNPADK